MTDKYVRTRLNMRASTASDYSKPFADEQFEMLITQKDEAALVPVALSTTAHTITTSHATAGFCLAVWNEDASGGDDILVTVHQQTGTRAATAGGVTFANANPDTIIDNDGGDFTTTPEFARIGGYVRVTSSEDSGNDGTYLIQNISDSLATNDLITVGAAETLTATVAAPDSDAVLYFQNRLVFEVAPQEYCYIGTFEPANNIVLQAKTNSAIGRVFFCLE